MAHENSSHFLNMLSMIKENHLAGIRQTRALNLTVNRLKYATAATACAYARMIDKDEQKRREFYKEPFWDDQERFNATKKLLHVMMYIDNAKEGGNYKLASAHSVALQALRDDVTVADEDLVLHIESHGGFCGVEAEKAKENLDHTYTGQGATAQPKGTAPLIFAHRDDLIEDDEDEQEDEPSGNADGVSSRPVCKTAKPTSSLKLLPRRYVELCILGRPSDANDREAILRQLRNGKSVWLKYVPGRVSDEYELYEGGGGFIETLIEDYEVED